MSKEQVDLNDLGREANAVLLQTVLKEHISNSRWKKVKRWLFMIIILVFVSFTALVKLSELGYEFLPNGKVVAVVPIKGVVADGKSASADAVIPIITKLFEQPNIKGIVLDIQSGGGSPNEAERIYKTIERLKKKTGKKVISVCDSVCASAAYMMAIRGDKVYASEYTMVGSIGAIIQGWDFSESIKLADAKYRIFKSGKHKDFISPYKPVSKDTSVEIQRLVDDFANIFIEDVKQVRDGKLINDENLFTGNVWAAHQAVDFGLIDEIGTLEEVLEAHWPGVASTRFMPRTADSDFLDRVFGYVDTKIDAVLGLNSFSRVEM